MGCIKLTYQENEPLLKCVWNKTAREKPVQLFYTPDPFIQAPEFSLSFNRYSYCLNNPLRYTDPTGFFAEGPDLNASGINNNIVGDNDLGSANGSAEANGSTTRQTNPEWWVTEDGVPIGKDERRDGVEYVVTLKSDEEKIRTATANREIVESSMLEGWAPPKAAYDLVKASMILGPVGQVGTCPNCLDPSTVGQNWFGLSYPGGDNPRTYAGDYSYSYVPTRSSEYPAIGHDRRYDNLGIAGAKGLLTDTRAIGADWRFVGEELYTALNPFVDPISRMQSGILGVGLGVAALPKTFYQLSQTNGLKNIIIWYNISNKGVTNTPDTYKHKKNRQ